MWEEKPTKRFFYQIMKNKYTYIYKTEKKKDRKKVETQIKLRNTDDWRGTFLIDQSLLM